MGFRRFRLEGYSPELLDALTQAKLIQVNPNARYNFKFDARFADQNISIIIPVKRADFSEEKINGTPFVKFKIDVYVYFNFRKVDKISVSRTLTFQREKLLNMKKIQFKIPYLPISKGKYYLDIIIEDCVSGAKYRKIIKVKY